MAEKVTHSSVVCLRLCLVALFMCSEVRPQSPDALASEVRLLRQTVEDRLRLLAQAEIGALRVLAQERRVDASAAEEGQVRRELARALSEQAKAEAAVQEVQEEAPDQSSMRYDSWKAALRTARLDALGASTLVQELRALLDELAAARKGAQKKLDELNGAMNGVEAALSSSSGGHRP